MFYLSGNGTGQYGSIFFDASSGQPPGGHTVTPYTTANAVCAGGSAPPPQLNLPSTVSGNVLVGQCTTKGTYLGAPNETAGSVRGLLFFADHANSDIKGQPSMQGGGGLVISGNMYFHSTGYNAFFNLQGNSGGAAYVLGNITTDELILAGNGNISMLLNPNAVYNILKASLLQ